MTVTFILYEKLVRLMQQIKLLKIRSTKLNCGYFWHNMHKYDVKTKKSNFAYIFLQLKWSNFAYIILSFAYNILSQSKM